jgi:hypothetical protein
VRRDRFLWAVLIFGMLLRLWRIRGDLPYVFHLDEPTLVDNAVWMWQNRTLDPRFFHYPTGMIYLLAALYGILMLGGIAVGRFGGWSGALAWLSSHAYARPPEGGVLYFYPVVGVSALYLIGRIVSVIASTATIALVYAIAVRGGGGRRLARVAAVLLAVSPLAVEHARYVTTDTTAMLLATACVLAGISARNGSTRDWIVTGALAGLAAGFKYNAGLVLIVLPVLGYWCARGAGAQPAGGREARSLALRRIAIAAAAATIAFVLTTPYALLDAHTFLRDVAYETARVGAGAGAVKGLEEVSGSDKVASVFWNALGIAGILAAAWGTFIAIRSRKLAAHRFAWVAILAWCAVSLAPLLLGKVVYARYMLPVWPAILLLAALGVDDAAERIGIRAGAGLARPPGTQGRQTAAIAPTVAALALTTILLVPGTVRLARREAGRAHADPRIEMTAWIEAHVPPGERIASEPSGPFPSGDRYGIEQVDFIGRWSPDRYRSRGVRYLATTGRDRFVEGDARYDEIRGNLRAIREESDRVWAGGRYAIYRLRGGALWEDAVQEALQAGDASSARGILEDAVRAGESSPYAWRMLGDARVASGDTAAAIVAFATAARADTADAELPLTIGVLSMKCGDYDEAIRQFTRASRLGPGDNPLVQHNLAVAYLSRARTRLRAGDAPGARRDWETALASARTCAKYAQGDPKMAGTLETVMRAGGRWGFVE